MHDESVPLREAAGEAGNVSLVAPMVATSRSTLLRLVESLEDHNCMDVLDQISAFARTMRSGIQTIDPKLRVLTEVRRSRRMSRFQGEAMSEPDFDEAVMGDSGNFAVGGGFTMGPPLVARGGDQGLAPKLIEEAMGFAQSFLRAQERQAAYRAVASARAAGDTELVNRLMTIIEGDSPAPVRDFDIQDAPPIEDLAPRPPRGAMAVGGAG